MRRIFAFFVSLVMLADSGYAADAKTLRVAILDPALPGNEDVALQMGVRELISSCFVNYGNTYSIVERSQLDKVMQEAKFSNTDAVDESQATELGRLAGADRVVLSVISKMGNRSLISVKMINVETASIEKQQSKIVETDALLDAIEPVTMAILDINANVNINVNANIDESKDDSQSMRQNKSQNNGKTVMADVSAGDPFAEVIGDAGKMPSIECALPSQSKDFRTEKLIPLLDVSDINVVYDWSELQIENMSFIAYMQQMCENDQTKIDEERLRADEYIRNAIPSFVVKANDKLKETQLSSIRVNSPMRLIVKLRKTDTIGWKYLVDFVFVNTETKEILTGIRCEKNAYKILGMRGSIVYNATVNAIKDRLKDFPPSTFLEYISLAMEEMGSDFGKKLNNALKDAKKKANK